MDIINGLSVAVLSGAAGYTIITVGQFFTSRAKHYDAQAQKVAAETDHVREQASAQSLNVLIGYEQLEMQKNTRRLQTEQVSVELSKLRAKQEGKDYLDKLHAERNDPLDA